MMIPSEALSPAARAAYAELKRSLMASPVLDLRGSPTRVQRGGKVYWYDSYRVGADVRKIYLGEDSDALRSRLLHARALVQGEEERKLSRVRAIRLLKAEGATGVSGGTGSLLAALASAGTFRLGLTVIGVNALRLYAGELGTALPTDDTEAEKLDLALPKSPSEALLKALAEFAFDPIPALRQAHTWRWRQARGETHVGVFMPSADETETPRFVEALGVYAQTRPCTAWLTAETMTVAVPYRSGILVNVPKPERFAVDKLLLSMRRPEGLHGPSAIRDRQQAAAIMLELEAQQQDLLWTAWQEALGFWGGELEAALSLCPTPDRLVKVLGG
jgi:hypothetical protein